jgi:hypothetical protein
MHGQEGLVGAVHPCPGLLQRLRPGYPGKAPTPITPGSPVITRVLRTATTASLISIRLRALVSVMNSYRSIPFQGCKHAANR